MNAAKRKFNKRVKANRRRAAYLRRKGKGGKTIDFSKFMQSIQIPDPTKKKESFFSKLNIFKRK